MAQINFDASKVEPNAVMEAIPAGWYNVMVDQSEMKPAKAEGNFYLEVRLSVLDGQYVNRKLFTRMNLRNNNPQAQEIAYKELSGLCRAAGKMQVGDSAELHGIPLKVKVKVKAADGQYEASNDVTNFANINQATAPGAVAPPAAAPWAPPAAPAAQAPQAWAAPQAPAQQFAPPQAPVQAAPAAWAPPAVQQPWAAAPAAPAPAPAPQAPPVQAAPQAQGATPSYMQGVAPGATPPWMQGVAPGAPVAGAAPPWATPTA